MSAGCKGLLCVVCVYLQGVFVCLSGMSVGCVSSVCTCVVYLHVSSVCLLVRGGVSAGCVYETCLCICQVVQVLCVCLQGVQVPA